MGKALGPAVFSGVNGALISSDLICEALTESGAGSSRYREAQVGNHERGCGFPSPSLPISCLRGGRGRGNKAVRKPGGELAPLLEAITQAPVIHKGESFLEAKAKGKEAGRTRGRIRG